MENLIVPHVSSPRGSSCKFSWKSIDWCYSVSYATYLKALIYASRIILTFRAFLVKQLLLIKYTNMYMSEFNNHPGLSDLICSLANSIIVLHLPSDARIRGPHKVLVLVHMCLVNLSCHVLCSITGKWGCFRFFWFLSEKALFLTDLVSSNCNQKQKYNVAKVTTPPNSSLLQIPLKLKVIKLNSRKMFNSDGMCGHGVLHGYFMAMLRCRFHSQEIAMEYQFQWILS